MHSSRMRAALLSGHLRGVCLGGCLPRVLSAQGDEPAQGKCLPRGSVCPGEVSAQGKCLPRGFCLGGCTPEVHAGIHTPSAYCMLGYTSPLLCGQTDTCENFTFPQLLLRAVISRSTILAKCVNYSSIHAKCCSQNTFETRNSYTIVMRCNKAMNQMLSLDILKSHWMECFFINCPMAVSVHMWDTFTNIAKDPMRLSCWLCNHHIKL